MSEINDFLDSDLKRFAQTLIAEREAADRMVQYYLTLSSALLGGYFFLLINSKISYLPKSMVIMLLLVWLVSGIAVFVRLLKRNLIGRLYATRVRDARNMRAKESKQLSSIIQHLNGQEDAVNQPDNFRSKVDRYLGGFGLAVVLFNCIILVIIFDQAPWDYTFCINASTIMGLSAGIVFQGLLWRWSVKRKIPSLPDEPNNPAQQKI